MRNTTYTIVMAVVALASIAFATPQLITLAGAGAGFANGFGTAARFNGPVDIKGDGHQGHIHIADRSNQAIRHYNIDTTEVTTRTTGALQVISVSPLDSNGNLYFSEQSQNKLWKLSASGVITLVASDTRSYGVWLHSDGFIYAASISYCVVWKIDPSNGAKTVYAGLSGSCSWGSNNVYRTSARYTALLNSAMTPGGDFYTIMYTNNGAVKIDWTSGISSLIAGLPGSSGNVDGSTANSRIGNAYAVTVSCDGYAYIADYSYNRIKRVYGGQVTTVAGTGSASSVDGPALSSPTNWPWGLSAHIATKVHIMEYQGHKLRVLTEQPHGGCGGANYCCQPQYDECADIHATCDGMPLSVLQTACQSDAQLCGVYNAAVAVHNSCVRLAGDCDALIAEC